MTKKKQPECSLGDRLRVENLDNSKELGLGTFLGEFFFGSFPGKITRIYLDSGAIIFGNQCQYKKLKPPVQEVDPFDLILTGPVRVFEVPEKHKMKDTNHFFPRGMKVRIERIEVKFYDSKNHVVFLTSEGYYLIITEISLPFYEELISETEN